MTWPLPPSLFFLSLTLLIVQHVVVPVEAQDQAQAQIQAPACLPAAMAVWNWTYNSFNQSPCQIAAYLAAQCNDGQYTIEQIPQGGNYTGPSGSDAGDICRCNSVYYSLISACTGCQRGVWKPYDQWYANCTTISPMSTFPQSIDNDTGVPAWAFVNVSDTVPWDNVTACAVGDNPESAGISRPPFAPQFDTGDAVRVGVIAGVAVGCTVAVLVIVGTGAWFYWRRYKRRRQQDRPVSPQLEQYVDAPAGQENAKFGMITPWTPNSDKKFYNPSDPTTYPDPGVLSAGGASPAVTNAAEAVKDTSNPNSTDHSATENSGQYPSPYSSNRYSGYPEI